MQLGVLLFKKSGKQGTLKFILTMVGAGLGMMILLLIFSIAHALNSVSDRSIWRQSLFLHNESVDSDHPLSRRELTKPNGVLFSPVGSSSTDSFLGKTIYVYDMHFTGGSIPNGSPLTRYPASHEYYVSPALDRLMSQYPSDSLADRFSGKKVGVIPDASLVSPDELMVIEGIDAEKLTNLGNNQQTNVMRINDFSSSNSKSQTAKHTLVIAVMGIGAIGLIVPVMILITTATRLGAKEREMRYAALRLVGATKKQINTITFIDSLVASLGGIVIGLFGYILLHPFIGRVHFLGQAFFPDDIGVSPTGLFATTTLTCLLIWFMNKRALSSIRTQPLSVARGQQIVRAPRVWRVIPLAIGVLLLGVLTIFDKAHMQPQFATLYPFYLFTCFILILSGLMLGGSWVIKICGSLIGYSNHSVTAVLLSKRFKYDHATIFQGVKGVIVGFFVGTFLMTSLLALVNLSELWSSQLLRALPDNSIIITATSDPQDAQNLQNIISQTSGYRSTPARVFGLKDGKMIMGCDDARDVFRLACEDNAPFVYIPDNAIDKPSQQLSRAPASFNLDADIVSTQYVYMPKSADSVDSLTAEKIITKSTKLSSNNKVLIVNKALRSDAIDSNASGFKGLLYAGIVATVIIAGLNLIAATIAGLFDRKGSFYALRLSGFELGHLKNIVILESIIPLLIILTASIGLGIQMAYVFTRLISSSLGHAFALPSYVFWLSIGAIFLMVYVSLRILLLSFDRLIELDSQQNDKYRE